MPRFHALPLLTATLDHRAHLSPPPSPSPRLPPRPTPRPARPSPARATPRPSKPPPPSPLVQSAYNFLLVADRPHSANDNLRVRDLRRPRQPRAPASSTAPNLKPADKQAIVADLLAQGLLNPADNATFPAAASSPASFRPCSTTPAPARTCRSASGPPPAPAFGGHHSYPGGLPVHESNNDTADIDLAAEYGNVYGSSNPRRSPRHRQRPRHPQSHARHAPAPNILGLSHDIIVGAPLWHDWAKSIVFQWNADGSEFQELSIGGSGSRHGRLLRRPWRRPHRRPPHPLARRIHDPQPLARLHHHPGLRPLHPHQRQ